MFTSERISAQELLSCGLVSKILPARTFRDEVLAIARWIAQQPAEAVRVNKQMMLIACKDYLHRANEVELFHYQDLLTKADAKRAAQTFAFEQAAKKVTNGNRGVGRL